MTNLNAWSDVQRKSKSQPDPFDIPRAALKLAIASDEMMI
jgi:hypothetical protein